MEEVFRTNSINFTLLASGALFVLILFAIYIKEKSEFLNNLLFWSMALVILANTLYLGGSTIYLNSISVTGGPIHWHADFEIWNCGKKLDLVNPKGLSNKVGTPVLHEHNDGRIHVEGVVVDFDEIALGNFFKVVNGQLTKTSLLVPTTEGNIMIQNGQLCSGEPGELQVFVFKTLENVYSQGKLENPARYVLTGKSNVPPGDCFIVEFDRPKEKTDKLCEQYKVKVSLGELTPI